MKKITLVCLAVLTSMAYSCKKSNEEKDTVEETTVQEETAEASKYILLSNGVEVNFTAYKTTDKTPVGGTFKKFEITKTTTADTALEALNGSEFRIPVSSLFTNDATNTRDAKIIEFFFGAMNNTEFITGTFKVAEDETCSIDITLNGETASITLEKEMIAENKYNFKGIMNLENWGAMDAVKSINKACEALHTGADGVSMTWSEVAVEANVTLKKS